MGQIFRQVVPCDAGALVTSFVLMSAWTRFSWQLVRRAKLTGNLFPSPSIIVPLFWLFRIGIGCSNLVLPNESIFRNAIPPPTHPPLYCHSLIVSTSPTTSPPKILDTMLTFSFHLCVVLDKTPPFYETPRNCHSSHPLPICQISVKYRFLSYICPYLSAAFGDIFFLFSWAKRYLMHKSRPLWRPACCAPNSQCYIPAGWGHFCMHGSDSMQASILILCELMNLIDHILVAETG